MLGAFPLVLPDFHVGSRRMEVGLEEQEKQEKPERRSRRLQELEQEKMSYWEAGVQQPEVERF